MYGVSSENMYLDLRVTEEDNWGGGHMLSQLCFDIWRLHIFNCLRHSTENNSNFKKCMNIFFLLYEIMRESHNSGMSGVRGIVWNMDLFWKPVVWKKSTLSKVKRREVYSLWSADCIWKYPGPKGFSWFFFFSRSGELYLRSFAALS